MNTGFVADSFRFGSNHAPVLETVVIVFVSALMVLGCGLALRYLRRRSRRPEPIADHWQALEVMGELCPEGWQARIGVRGGGAPVPEDAPSSGRHVELEWKQFEGQPARVAVVRRLWAPTIGEALSAMVEDRRTDMTLEQIERAFADAHDPWP